MNKRGRFSCSEVALNSIGGSPPLYGLILLLLALMCASPVAARSGDIIVGFVTHVRDGDTIEVNRIPVRLNGLHAPELNEPGGEAARTWMVEHTRGQQITCRLNGDRNRDRYIGICTNRDGDLSAQLVAAGLGRDCPRWSGGRYARFERPEATRMPLPTYCYGR